MLCKNPYVKGVLPFGCGQCGPCRYNRRRLWTHRIMLEGLCHEKNSFVTLTYDDENLPSGNNLNPEHTRLWLMSLRKALGAQKIRYYLVGEYGHEGKRGWNPHYHLALFNYQHCWDYDPHRKNQCWCDPCKLLHNTWGMGRIDNGRLEPESASYIAGYVTKKMTNKNDPRLEGHTPEFARMSLKPGIAANAMDTVFESLIGYLPDGDVPSQLTHGKRNLPLGRYLRSQLRKRFGFDETGLPKEMLEAWKKEMRQLWKDNVPTSEVKKAYAPSEMKALILDTFKQKVLNHEAKQKLYAKGGSL